MYGKKHMKKMGRKGMEKKVGGKRTPTAPAYPPK
jgi:hypothetical protein